MTRKGGEGEEGSREREGGRKNEAKQETRKNVAREERREACVDWKKKGEKGRCKRKGMFDKRAKGRRVVWQAKGQGVKVGDGTVCLEKTFPTC